MEKRALRCLELLVIAGTLLGGGWLLLRFVLPGLAPFLPAWLLAALTEPAVRALTRLRIRRAAAAGLVTLGLLALLLFLAARLLSAGITALQELTAQLPELAAALQARIDAAEGALLAMAQKDPGAELALKAVLDALSRSLSAVPESLSRAVLGAAGTAAQRSPDVLLFLVTAGLGSFFLSASFPQVRAFLLAQIPPRRLRQLELLTQDLKQSFGGWLRAQLWLMLITFAELLAAFLILRVRAPILAAALTAFVDALPVFGVGAVLVPWAGVALLRGELRLGLGLLISFAVTSLARNILQAKLLGDQIGLDPLSSLLAVYVGWKLCGFWGLLLFPLLLVMLRRLNERGLLRLWKQP
ncbi:MAG: sporulation integral membrane protein YtvI [Oscillospiraceae bacterium]|nr:sporulation integral membrane protein YtvI [Oscillospiraceae bacterium]